MGFDDVPETSRAIVCEELRKLLPSSNLQVVSIAHMTMHDLKGSLGVSELPAGSPHPVPQANSYAAVASGQVFFHARARAP